MALSPFVGVPARYRAPRGLSSPPACGTIIALVAPIYVTGHRNPDTDSIASAIGYAELKARLDPRNEYVPVRLGECNAQTRWVLERSGAPEPRLLPHVMLRACDVMSDNFPVAGRVWVQAMDPSAPSGITEGDVVVTGNRADNQRRAIELGAAAVVLSNDSEPSPDALELARERGTTVVVSPLDTYVSGRMIT